MSVIAILDDIKKLSVMELAELVTAIEEAFGVSAAAPVAAGAAVAATEEVVQAAEKQEYKVTLKGAGTDKIKVIKALRAGVTGLGLKEAKDMTEAAPAVVSEAMPKDDAQKLKKALEEAGATVELS